MFYFFKKEKILQEKLLQSDSRCGRRKWLKNFKLKDEFLDIYVLLRNT